MSVTGGEKEFIRLSADTRWAHTAQSRSQSPWEWLWSAWTKMKKVECTAAVAKITASAADTKRTANPARTGAAERLWIRLRDVEVVSMMSIN